MTRPIREREPSLFEAIRSRSPSAVRKAIEAEGDHAVKERDGRGWTPLMAAAEEGHAGITWVVLRAALRAVRVAGLREVANGPDGLDALGIAAEHGHRATFNLLARWLPEDGFIVPYPKVQNPPGRDFGDGATINRLVAAAADGRFDEVEFCLARGVEVDGVSDTANAIGYALYDSGELLERMQYGEGEDIEVATTFTSRLRSLSADEIGSPFEFADAFLREQEAFAPAFGPLMGVFAKVAGRISFGIGGMEAEDFERVDVIHLGKDAVSRRMKGLKERHGPMPEPDPDRLEDGGADDEDLPF